MKKRPIIIAATLLLILTTTSAMAGIVVLETDGNGKPTRWAGNYHISGSYLPITTTALP